MKQQAPIEDPKLEGVLFYQIEQAMRQSIRYTHRIFSEAGIDLTKDQWLVLKKVHDEDGVAPLEIANVLGKEAASMTRILDILERKQLLKREQNPADRRSSLVFCTNEGKEIYARVLPLVKDIRNQAVRGMTAEELNELRISLQKIFHNLE
ncbi:MAG: DNA-binding MarR family transcriptional regulator [Neolewinella sp.]|jgi:DNA-binding MarR family transcriptional regulator